MTSNTEDATVKLTDFGFAVKDEGNNINQQWGTPGYMAPEIIQKLPYGKIYEYFII